jgi:hypothetical protein
MSDLDRILKLASHGTADARSQAPAERELKDVPVVEEPTTTREAVGEFADPILDLCDELGCDSDHPVLDELIRYLDGDTIKDFVADFRRHNDMNGDMDEAYLKASDYKCKDCGDTMHSPTTDCSHDSHDEKGDWWVDKDGNGVPDSLEEAPNEGNEFSGALAQAKKDGKKEFEVDGKKYKVESEEAVTEGDVPEYACINIDTGAFGYCDKDELHKFTHMVPASEFTYFDPGSGINFADFDDELADQEGWTKIGNPEVGDPELARLKKLAGNIGEENINELNVPNNKEEVIARIQKLDKMADEARANDDPNKAMAIERGSEMTALYNKLEKLGGDPFNIPDASDANWVTPEGGPLSYKKVGEYTYIVKDENGKEHKAEMGAMDDTQDNYSGDEVEKTMDQEGLQMLIRQAKMGAPTEEISEAPTMDTTQLITLLKNAGLSEEKIKTKLDEWANTPDGAAEEEATSHGEPYENFAQSVNLSLKRYLDAEDMKVGLKEHKVEDIKEAYKKSKGEK